MEIVPLGVGDAFAKTLYQTNFLVRPADGEPFLVDCGHTASRALRALGLELRAVPRVLVSHLHADHIGGLEELGFAGYFGWGLRPRLYVPENLLPWLWPHALEAGMGQRLRGAEGFFEARLETYFEVTALAGGGAFDLGSVRVTPFPTPHVPGRPSWGFRLEDRATGGRVLLTCDTRFHPKTLDAFGADADAVFHDCQFVTNGAHIHATLDELQTLPEAWHERLLLVHYADDWPDHAHRLGRLRLAEQGRVYRF
ncbi:MBL fold metallo-hydrolase [Deferrisoma palaeochoriense]